MSPEPRRPDGAGREPGSNSPICIDVSPEPRRSTDSASPMDVDPALGSLPSSSFSARTDSSARSTQPSQPPLQRPPQRPSQRPPPPASSGSGPGAATATAALPTLRTAAERARSLPYGQQMRPRPLHAVLVGIEGRLGYRDAEGRPLQQFRFEVYLDDGSARQRCRVASELVTRWLGGVDAPGLAALPEAARTVAVSELKRFLMKAEGMWTVEFPGGAGSVPLVVDMSSGIRSGDQLVAALRDKCRRYYPTP